MLSDNFINNKYNALVSIKEININCNENIYIYRFNCLCVSIIEKLIHNKNVIFIDKYINSKYISLQRNNDFDKDFDPQWESLRFDAYGEFIIISNKPLYTFTIYTNLISKSNKIYIVTYYNTIYKSLMRNIIFDKDNLE